MFLASCLIEKILLSEEFVTREFPIGSACLRRVSLLFLIEHVKVQIMIYLYVIQMCLVLVFS